MIEDLKKYQSIQKSHEGIKNQVFILVILFWVKKGYYENKIFGFDLLLIKTLVDFKKIWGFCFSWYVFAFEKELQR